jgi:hypothetical protein
MCGLQLTVMVQINLFVGHSDDILLRCGYCGSWLGRDANRLNYGNVSDGELYIIFFTDKGVAGNFLV